MMINRVQNEIKMIKRNLSTGKDFELYNDFLIINQIVPKLPQITLVEMLLALRPIHDKLNKTSHQPHIIIRPILDVLASAQVNDDLLNDFLHSSYHPPLTIPMPTC